MRRYLVTITDNIAPTSMPYNEFMLYRRKHELDEKQVVILLFKTQVNQFVEVPTDLELYCIGRDVHQLKSVVNGIIKRAEKDAALYVFHIHEAKSVLLFNFATGGKYRNYIVYTLHSTYINYPLRNKLLSYIASAQCGKVVCVSQTSYRHYPARLRSKLGNKVCFIQNGMDADRINEVVLKAKKSDDDFLTLVYVARLVTLKQHNILFEALKSLSRIRLFIVGSGPLQQQLAKDVKDKRIEDKVCFFGQLPRDKVYELLSQTDVYVSSSSYEGLPISVLEAMSCGVVCAVSDIEQHREIQEKCLSLITVDNTAEGWVGAIQRIAAMSAEERERIGNQNKRDVDQFFSLARMHAQYDQVYDEVAKGGIK